MTLLREEEFKILQMDGPSQLAANCPRCFGPAVALGPCASADEPDIIVCMDGNFQHRRHQAASVPIRGRELLRPELFIDPSSVVAMSKVFAPHKTNQNQAQKSETNGLIVSHLKPISNV